MFLFKIDIFWGLDGRVSLIRPSPSACWNRIILFENLDPPEFSLHGFQIRYLDDYQAAAGGTGDVAFACDLFPWAGCPLFGILIDLAFGVVYRDAKLVHDVCAYQ